MKQKIKINIYDILDVRLLKTIGLGVHHSGVQIGDCSEYQFGDGYGISVIEPKTANGATFSHSIDIGTIKQEIVDETLREMYTEFTCDNYDLLSRNCNHFTEQFVYKLTRFRGPKYLNRVASLFAYDKHRKANILFIEYLNKAKIAWFPITNTMRDLAEKGILNDEILQIGVLNQHSDRLKRIYHKGYRFEDTIYGFKVYTKERPLVANIWLFDKNPNNEFMTVYSGPKNTFLLHRLLKNEWIRTQYLDNKFVYHYDKTHINMFTNAADYIQIINGSPKYNMFIRFLLTGHLCFREFTRDSDSTMP
jgi:hypothetical protein